MKKKCQSDLIRYLFENGTIKHKEVCEAMERVDRQYYAPRHPYEDTPQPIGYNATISAPHMHAYAMEYLLSKLTTASNVLDVGSGTGYLTAAMAYLVPPNAKVYGIEHVPELVQMSLNNIKKSNPELLKGDRIEIIQGDGREGWPNKDIKFDVIHVGAAAAKMPEGLITQLAEGGKMVIPVGGEHSIQSFVEVNKVDGVAKEKHVMSVRYVPLTDLK